MQCDQIFSIFLILTYSKIQGKTITLKYIGPKLFKF